MPETSSQLIQGGAEVMKNSAGEPSAVNGSHFQVCTSALFGLSFLHLSFLCKVIINFI